MNLRQREAIMSARYAEMQAIYDRRGENGALGKMAADWLRTRAKNNLHLAWESDPTVEGRTCHLPPELERKAIDFLLKHNLDLSKPDEVTGEKLSYRAVDRALWAYELHRQGKISDTSVAKRVNLLLRQERQQMAKLAKLPKWDQA